MSKDAKITLSAEHLYIIRSQRTTPQGVVVVMYYMTPSTWTSAPPHATIFSYEAAEAHMVLYHQRDGGYEWHDGSTEILEVVPLYGEIMNCPNNGNGNITQIRNTGDDE